jgi:hypothetical protein
MVETNWEERGLRSEIELSRALGGEPTQHEGFVHVLNRAVPWGGDFNRVVAARLDGVASLDEAVARAERIHGEHGLDPLDRIDVLPPALDDATWKDPLSARGWRATRSCSSAPRPERGLSRPASCSAGRTRASTWTGSTASRGAEHVLLQSDERLRAFYESCGYEECARCSVLRRVSIAG